MELDTRELFEYSKVFQRHLRYKDYWQEILKTKIEIFANPYDFINDISEQIVELTTDDIAQDLLDLFIS